MFSVLSVRLKCKAHFRAQKLSSDAQSADYAFELAWLNPEHATPPLDLLAATGGAFRDQIL